jgi:hypothetical protein
METHVYSKREDQLANNVTMPSSNSAAADNN